MKEVNPLWEYAWTKAQFDQAARHADPVIESAKNIIKSIKEFCGYDARKKAMDSAKQYVIDWAKTELHDGRNTVDDYGWVDVTPQPPVATVVDMRELLLSIDAHQFIKSIVLTDSASAHLREGGTIPGLALEDQEPRIRMSVLEYEKGCKEQEGETHE